jgi:hypothetical protein
VGRRRIVGVLNEGRGLMHLDFLSKRVFRALFVFHRARVRAGCMGWHGALEHGIRAYHDRIRIKSFSTYLGKVRLLSTRGLFKSQLEVRRCAILNTQAEDFMRRNCGRSRTMERSFQSY